MDPRAAGWLQTTACPECNAPAEVVARHVLESTDGPVEHARVRCVALHVFNLPVAMLASPSPERQPRSPRSVPAPRVPRPPAS